MLYVRFYNSWRFSKNKILGSLKLLFHQWCKGFEERLCERWRREYKHFINFTKKSNKRFFFKKKYFFIFFFGCAKKRKIS